MNFLVDTNVFSEMARPTPSPVVDRWLENHYADLYVSVITMAEIRYGIGIMVDSKRKDSLQSWFSRLATSMEGRILAFNRSVANVWADMRISLSSEGIRLPAVDGMIAATAKRHQLAVATRDVSDFERTGIRVVNPFEEAPR